MSKILCLEEAIVYLQLLCRNNPENEEMYEAVTMLVKRYKDLQVAYNDQRDNFDECVTARTERLIVTKDNRISELEDRISGYQSRCNRASDILAGYVED